MSTIHIIGAGLAGLSTAVRLIREGRPVRVYEGARRAGGRCRSFVDASIGQLIDNGNHLVMSGNHSALTYLDEIGARDTVIEPPHAIYPFVDLKTGDRWTLKPGKSRIPVWLFDRARRVPDTGVTDYFEILKIALAGSKRNVSEVIRMDGPLYERFWEPLTLAALNTVPQRGTASLLWAVLRETFMKGEAACRPVIARDGLGPTFIDPATSLLEACGKSIRYNALLRSMTIADNTVTALDFGAETVALEPGDGVVLAVPPHRAADLIPGLPVPGEGETIVNAHFRIPEPFSLPGGVPVIGVLNSLTHWIFVRDDIVSLTISAAGDVADRTSDELIPVLWEETRRALDLPHETWSAARIIKERRATFDQSPESVAKRPKPKTGMRNLFLAGDWTDTGLPATIESAVRSGHNAAAAVTRALAA